MKKLIFTVVFFWLFSVAACCAPLTAQKLDFKQNTGGKFIYCNNPEGITNGFLADSTAENPSYIMNNENLGPDNYSIYLTHFNRTTKTAADGSNLPGENIYLDVQITAKEKTALTVKKTAFQIPRSNALYGGGKLVFKEDSWSSQQGCADFMQQSITSLENGEVFSPKPQKEQTVVLEAGESAYLGDYTDNYASVPYPLHVFFAAEFEIVSGMADVNVFAVSDENTYASAFARYQLPESSPGKYARDKTQKGVSDGAAIVRAVLDYTIDSDVPDGTALPVEITNQFVPDGNICTKWCTHLNPQADLYAKNIVAESDMLTFKYKDDEKLGFYGKNADEALKDNIWIFDTHRSDTKGFESGNSPYSPQDYIPNYLLSTDKSHPDTACNLGNYGVSAEYELHLTNSGDTDRYLDYVVTSSTDVIVSVTNENGENVQPVLSKGMDFSQKTKTMASLLLPARRDSVYIVSITLPPQTYGGPQQSFVLGSTKTEILPETDDYLPVYTVSSRLNDTPGLLKNSDGETKKIFSNPENFKIQKTDSGYAAFFNVTAANPNYYSYLTDITGNVYILDENFCITQTCRPGSQPVDISCVKGVVYVKTADGSVFEIKDGVMQRSNGDLPIYCGNTVLRKNGEKYQLSFDGSTFFDISYQSHTPPFIMAADSVFYYAAGKNAGVSFDGVYWTHDAFSENPTSLMSGINYIKNGGERIEIYSKGTPFVCINGEILGFDRKPMIIDNRTVVPMRYIFEKFGMEVSWDEKTYTATASGNGKTFDFPIGSSVAYINGERHTMDVFAVQIDDRTLIPLRFLSENLGYSVDWNADYSLVTITDKK